MIEFSKVYVPLTGLIVFLKVGVPCPFAPSHPGDEID